MSDVIYRAQVQGVLVLVCVQTAPMSLVSAELFPDFNSSRSLSLFAELKLGYEGDVLTLNGVSFSKWVNDYNFDHKLGYEKTLLNALLGVLAVHFDLSPEESFLIDVGLVVNDVSLIDSGSVVMPVKLPSLRVYRTESSSILEEFNKPFWSDEDSDVLGLTMRLVSNASRLIDDLDTEGEIKVRSLQHMKSLGYFIIPLVSFILIAASLLYGGVNLFGSVVIGVGALVVGLVLMNSWFQCQLEQDSSAEKVNKLAIKHAEDDLSRHFENVRAQHYALFKRAGEQYRPLVDLAEAVERHSKGEETVPLSDYIQKCMYRVN